MSELQRVQDAAFAKGFAFGKYTNDVPLEQDIIDLVDNSNELMREFLAEYRRGFTAGMLETIRN
ncbi:hypothetical protein [Acinetobacter sp. MD2]|uniref:hypothetical protein n=1 Tax=Acinetobacter sp. MD2 TaxID=2600066 RepID=UPI002D1E68F5|nr:hypothetical protein [Acinetobacter sp. MD2]MEB3767724.1 hypothetical protein [Acinetobacter sp. MD2]